MEHGWNWAICPVLSAVLLFIRVSWPICGAKRGQQADKWYNAEIELFMTKGLGAGSCGRVLYPWLVLSSLPVETIAQDHWNYDVWNCKTAHFSISTLNFMIHLLVLFSFCCLWCVLFDWWRFQITLLHTSCVWLKCQQSCGVIFLLMYTFILQDNSISCFAHTFYVSGSFCQIMFHYKVCHMLMRKIKVF